MHRQHTMAERQGFEPWDGKAINGFRDRPIQPLWHLSAYFKSVVSDGSFSFSQGSEKFLEHRGALMLKNTRHNFDIMIETLIPADIV